MTTSDGPPLKPQHQRKKWLMLSVVGAALLLIPRRSSQQATPSANTPNIDPDNKIKK